MILVGFLCFHFLQGVTSLQMLLIMNRSISILDTKDKSKFQHLTNTISGGMDYHYTNGHLYYTECGANSDIGELYRLNLQNPKEPPVLLPPRLEKVAVDWVHNELFAITLEKVNKLTKYDLNGNNAKTLVSEEDKTNLMKGVSDATALGKLFLCLDPYEGMLFATIRDRYDYYIIQTDLNGKNLKLFKKRSTNNVKAMMVEINAKRLHVVREIYMDSYDYQGKNVGLVTIGEKPYHMAHAFNSRIYMLYRTANRVIISEFVVESFSDGHLDEILNTGSPWVELGVLVYDPRQQRRRVQGQYECERRDCEQGCAVHPDSGDTCLCHDDYYLDPTSKKCIGSLCKVPDPPGNRNFSRHPCPRGQVCAMAPGTEVPHDSLVKVTCRPGYTVLSGDAAAPSAFLASCDFGTWSPRPPSCYKLCPPLASLTVKFTCYQGPRQVNCDQPLQPGTVVEYSCKEYHDSNDKTQLNGLTCTSSGEWSGQIPRCIPNCGKSNLNSHKIEAAILGEKFSENGNFPWHAGLYHFRNSSWEAVCGGTLISPSVILTAAHCVTSSCTGCKSTKMSPAEVKVALGKRYRSWANAERFQVKRGVKEIRVHKDYVGSSVNYGQDIAVLVMDSPVEVNNYVMPACVDFSRTHLQEFTEDRTLQGYAAGWGNTQECSSFGNVCDSVSEELKYAQTAVIFFNECFSLSQSLSNRTMTSSRLTSDKFCSGNGTVSVVQKGDSGGGLTFVFDGLHYVYGVVSLKLKLEIGDRSFYSFGAFTSVPHYLNWLQTQFYEISLSAEHTK